jgi:hypothetical protein
MVHGKLFETKNTEESIKAADRGKVPNVCTTYRTAGPLLN